MAFFSPPSVLAKFRLVPSRPKEPAAHPGIDDTGRSTRACVYRGCEERWTDQMTGAERSLVTVGRSLTVANGFPPLWNKRSRDEC